jgi:hypothetical protein
VSKPDLVVTTEIPMQAAFQRVARAMRAIAVTTDIDHKRKIVTGYVWHFQTQAVLTARLVHGEPIQIVLKTESFDITDMARQSALRRFQEAFENIDKEGFGGDKGGLPVGFYVAGAVVALAVTVLQWLGLISW